MPSLNRILFLVKGFFTYTGQFTLKMLFLLKLPTIVRFSPIFWGHYCRGSLPFEVRILHQANSIISAAECVNLLTIVFIDSLPVNLREIL